LTGVKVLWTFFERRIQPLKARAHPMFQYTGAGDPTRISPDELAPVKVKSRVWAVIRRQEDLPKINRHAAGLAPNPAARHAEHDPISMSACSLLRFDLRRPPSRPCSSLCFRHCAGGRTIRRCRKTGRRGPPTGRRQSANRRRAMREGGPGWPGLCAR
ncbi:hypothetical protein BAE44_0012237, partial [Dichanthelium oligosanthes]